MLDYKKESDLNGKVCHLYLGENELSDLLKSLPLDHYLRDYLQKAGQNIFNWKKW